jgi:hypothetical protein
MAVTLAVMATVYQIARSTAVLNHIEGFRAERGATGLRAVDEIALEVARAGFGLGKDVERILPGLPGGPPSRDAVTLRSNPEGLAGRFRDDLLGSEMPVRVIGGTLFRAGDRVLLADRTGPAERAVVVAAGGGMLAFRSLDTRDGTLVRTRRAGRGGRVLKLREVRFALVPAVGEEATLLQESVDDQPPRTLARYVGRMRFDYRDDADVPVHPALVARSGSVARVKVSLALLTTPDEPTLSAAAPTVEHGALLDAHEAMLAFDVPRHGCTMRRYFVGLANAVDVVSRPFDEAGMILGAGEPRGLGASYLYVFLLSRLTAAARATDMRIETLVPLQRMRDLVIQGPAVPGAVQAIFAPDESPLAGSLVVVSAGLREVLFWRVSPDPGGAIGPGSRIDLLGKTSVVSAAGAAAFGIDGGLYVTDPAQAALFRCVPSDSGVPPCDRVASLPGRPGPMALGLNGSLFVLSSVSSVGPNDAQVLEIPFDEGGKPLPPRNVAELPGTPLSLARDPVSGSLYALVRERGGDSVLLELSRAWLRRPAASPTEAFRLSRWKREIETAFPGGETPVLPLILRPSRADFAAFDAVGGLYLGASETRLVLKFDLDRPGGSADHTLGLTGVVEQERGSPRKRVRLYAWRNAVPGL